MKNNPRCLFESDISSFLYREKESIFGTMLANVHGIILATANEAWISEIEILQNVLLPWKNSAGRIIFEYDIPRLGKRIDVVLLIDGIIFCLEFKVGQSQILENDVDQVLDYALDLKNFHKYSSDRVIVPILIATRYEKYSTFIQKSVYDDRIVNPLVTGEKGICTLISEVLKYYPNETPVNDKWVIEKTKPPAMLGRME